MKPFKNILIYQFDEPFTLTAHELESQLSAHPLRECGRDELETYGWLPAFSQGQNFIEEANGAFFMRLGMEQKKVPRLAIKTAVEKRAREQEIDISTRARYKEVEEIIIDELVAKAFPEQSSMMAYIDASKGWLVVDATSEKKASTLTAVLRKTLGSLPVTGFAPQVELPMVMTHWVRSGLPSEHFAFLDEVELKEQKEEGGTARYKGLSLESREIQQNLESSEDHWQVVRLGLIYDELVTFSLGEDFILKRLRYLDGFQEQLELSDDQNAVAQSNAFLQVDTFRNLVSDLYNLCYDRENE